VKLDKNTGRWFIVPLKTALDKAKQGLRDEYVPGWLSGNDSNNKEAKKPASKKNTAPKRKSKTTLKNSTTTTTTRTKPQQQQAQDDDKPVDDELRQAISTLPSIKSNEVDILKLSPDYSLDLFSLPSLSLSNSLVGSSLYGVEKLLQSNDSIMESWDTGTQDNYWNERFLRDINPMIGFEAV
jgi:hypothetical protein